MPPRSYRLQLTRSAEKELLRLPPKIRRQVEQAIDRLLATLQAGERPQDMASLVGEPEGYRLDSGEYRILFYLLESDSLVKVIRIRHRKDVYRNL